MLFRSIENYLKTNNDKKAKCIKAAYESVKTYNTQSQIHKLATNFSNYFDELGKNVNSVWELLAFYNKNEMISWGCPFVWSINPDDKNPKIYRCYLESPQVTLIDIDVYFDDKEDTEEDKKYKTKYKELYNKCKDMEFSDDERD